MACGALQTPQTWEYCEIRIHTELVDPGATDVLLGDQDFKYRFRFWADGAGPDGVYTCGWSDWGEGEAPEERDQELHQRFVEELLASGWRPLPRTGGEWWAHRFRRPIKTGQLRGGSGERGES